MSPDQVRLGLVLVGVAFVVFLLLLCWALGVTLFDLLRLGASGSHFGRFVLRLQEQNARAERPWVERARAALGNLQPPPRKFGTLEGWSWRPIERDPIMTVRVQDRSPDGRRLGGYIIGTPGTLQVTCRAHTQLKLIEGWITLTAEDSPPVTLRAGDSLVIAPGFSGQWQNETITHLHYGVVLP